MRTIRYVDDVLELAVAAANRGIEVARAYAEQLSSLEFLEKDAGKNPGADIASIADVSVEQAIRSVITAARPQDRLIGEELGADPAQGSGLLWVLDPIDGTLNFSYGRRDWAVSIAASDTEGTVVAVVAQMEPARVFTAVRGHGARCDGVTLRVSACADVSRALVDLGRGRHRTRALFPAVVAVLDSSVRDIRRGGCAALAACQVANGELDAMYGPGLAPWDIAAGAFIAREAGAEVIDLASDVVLISAPSLSTDLVALLAPVVGEA